MSIFDMNMEDILNSPTTAADGAHVLSQLETSTPIHHLVALTSIAVSLTKIAASLSQINQTLHTGNLGQGSNLSGINQSLKDIKSEVGNVSQGVFQAVNAKAKALEDEVRRIRGY